MLPSGGSRTPLQARKQEAHAQVSSARKERIGAVGALHAGRKHSLDARELQFQQDENSDEQAIQDLNARHRQARELE